MALNDTIIRERLAFIRYFFNTGIEQSFKPEPQYALAVLTFHDAIELFFGLSCEHLGVTGQKDKTFFNEYWDLIAGELNGTRLSQEASIRRLNDARIALKHHGIRPSKSDVEGFRAASSLFFEDNTQTVFQIQFKELSLIDLVQFDETRNHLKQAQEFLKQSIIDNALEQTAIAFASLIKDYESRKLEQGGRSPFGPNENEDDAPLIYSSEMEFDQLIAGIPFGVRMENLFNWINDSISFLQKNVRILSLGLDYRKYTKFDRFTPIVDLASEKAPDTTWVNIIHPENFPTEDVQFCIDFVIESALKLQEYDYNLKMIYE